MDETEPALPVEKAWQSGDLLGSSTSPKRDCCREPPNADKDIMPQPDALACDWADDSAPFCVDEATDVLDPDALDTVIAKELTRLSMNDREQLLCEIHGVSSKIQETPQMIEESLHLLQKEVATIHPKDAYQQALESNPAFVQDPKFLIKFLRAERFDHTAAAKRLVKFFEFKLEFFGKSLLTTNIKQEHLDDEDLDVLYNGMGMDLPFRDRSGRLVFFQLSQPVNVPLRAILRKTFYAMMSLLDDEETQSSGAVVVSYIVGQQLNWEQMQQRRELNRLWATKYLPSIPLRMEVFHVCLNSVHWRPLIAVLKVATNMFTRIRIREHMGDHKQIISSLKALGVPTHGFPITEDGTIRRHLCSERWKKRRAQEQMVKQRNQRHVEDQTANRNEPSVHLMRVGTPGQNDVLLGRGKLYYSHAGNHRLKRIVMGQIEVYEEAGYAEKYKVSTNVVNFIKSIGGRFLRDDGNGWVEVDDETAIKKVSHGFRTMRGMKNANNAMKTVQSQSAGKQTGNGSLDYP